MRRRLGHGAWRATHWLAYLCWPVAVLHAVGTGSDIKQPWMLALIASLRAGRDRSPCGRGSGSAGPGRRGLRGGARRRVDRAARRRFAAVAAERSAGRRLGAPRGRPPRASDLR